MPLRRRPPSDADDSMLAELAQQARQAWRLFLDPSVPLALKLIPVAAVLYFLSPIDLVPDVPVLGQIDDVVVLLVALRMFVGMAPRDGAADEPPPAADEVTTSYRVRPD
jgi:uncharacterized membrane protein YkvA (DUF1232 family)